MDIQATARFIAKWEGCRLEAYKDVVGIVTIGYGTVNKRYKLGDKITQGEADNLLIDHLNGLAETLKPLVEDHLSDKQWGALLSLAYNIGVNAFKTSTLLKKLNSDAPNVEVASEFERWNKGGGKVIKGLTLRRQAEAALFLS